MEEKQATAEKQSKETLRSSRKRRSLPLVAFAVGLILGWIAIGWWLWPVEWVNCEPWHLRSEHQRTFVHLVAEQYWQSDNLSEVNQALKGWDREALATLVSRMESEATDAQEKEKLKTLAAALELPERDFSLFTTLSNRAGFLLSTLLSVSPLLIALALAVYPTIQQSARRLEAMSEAEQQTQTDQKVPEVQEAIESTSAPSLGPEAATTTTEEEPQEKSQGEKTPEAEGLPESSLEEGPQPGDEAILKGTESEEVDVPSQEAEPGQVAEEKTDDTSSAGEEQKKRVKTASPREEQETLDLDVEETEGDASDSTDIFLNPFDNENPELSQLEELCQLVDAVDIDQLLEQSQEVVRQTRRSNA